MKINELENQTTESAKMLSILVVDDDRICLAVVAGLLKRCNYTVLTARDPHDALCILRARTIKFDLVVADVHMPELDGFELQRLIHREFQLPVVLMSADQKASDICKESQGGASFFILKPVSTEDLKLLWDYGKQWMKKLAKGKNIISDYSYNNDDEDDIDNKLYEKNPKRKLQIIDDDDEDDGKNIVTKGKSLGVKKNKVAWTPDLHAKFLGALHFLGPKRAVPRNILEVMNVPALKREHVASHLQKQLEAAHDPNMLDRLKSKKRWTSSFLSHEALLGYGQSNLLTNPVFPPSGLTSSTYSSQMYQPGPPNFPSNDKIFSGYSSQMYQPGPPNFPSSDKNFSGFNSVQTLAPIHLNDNGFSAQIQPPNCYVGSGQEVYHTFVSQSNSASPAFGTFVPGQPYESADLSNIFFDGSTYQSTDVTKNQDHGVGNNVGDAFLVNEDMPNADKLFTNLDEQKNGEDVNLADNTGTFGFEPEGNQPSNDDQQESIDDLDDLLAFFLPDDNGGDNYF